jgi:multidrug efflux pump subunit AcrB
MDSKKSVFSRLIETFLKGHLAVLLMVVSVGAGAFALMATPREEEPQIVVPMADVMVAYPGGTAEEVEKLVASRLERMLYQVDGVSMCTPCRGRAWPSSRCGSLWARTARRA